MHVHDVGRGKEVVDIKYISFVLSISWYICIKKPHKKNLKLKKNLLNLEDNKEPQEDFSNE